MHFEGLTLYSLNTYVSPWPLSGPIHFNCAVKLVIFWVGARVSYLGLLDCKTVCEQTRHPKSSPFSRCFVFVYNTLIWTISQIPREDYRDVREKSWWVSLWKQLCRQSLNYFIWHIRVKVFSSHYSQNFINILFYFRMFDSKPCLKTKKKSATAVLARFLVQSPVF